MVLRIQDRSGPSYVMDRSLVSDHGPLTSLNYNIHQSISICVLMQVINLFHFHENKAIPIEGQGYIKKNLWNKYCKCHMSFPWLCTLKLFCQLAVTFIPWEGSNSKCPSLCSVVTFYPHNTSCVWSGLLYNKGKS